MVINIQGTDIELTDAIKQYAHDKISSLTKYFENIQQADIDIGRRSNHHKKGKVYFAEVNLHVPGKIVRVEKDCDELYKAIDKVKDHLKVELEDMKNKMRQVDRQEIRDQKGYEI